MPQMEEPFSVPVQGPQQEQIQYNRFWQHRPGGPLGGKNDCQERKRFSSDVDGLDRPDVTQRNAHTLLLRRPSPNSKKGRSISAEFANDDFRNTTVVFAVFENNPPDTMIYREKLVFSAGESTKTMTKISFARSEDAALDSPIKQVRFYAKEQGFSATSMVWDRFDFSELCHPQ